MGVSVIICCHNSAARLPATLQRLRDQRLTEFIPWEVIVVDNGSTDDTSAAARANWPAEAAAPLRVVTEQQLGLGFARLRGFREAVHDIISFIDDDNWVIDDWVTRVETLFAAHPDVGACGGKSEAVTEVVAPAWFAPIARHYAVGSQFPQTGNVTEMAGTLLWGAGLNIRKKAFLDVLSRGFTFMSPGRTGARVSSGEDTELCFALRAAGWQFWYDDELALQHFIPKERLTWSYALRLMRGLGQASVLMQLYLLALGQRPFHVYPLWKRTWFFQSLKSMSDAAALLLREPLTILRASEGSLPALRFEQIKGRLEALWQERHRYAEIQADIARRFGR